MSVKISRLLDGDLPAQETAEALDAMAGDADQRDRFTIYRLIGDTLRGNGTPDDGYSKRIFERIKREEQK